MKIFLFATQNMAGAYSGIKRVNKLLLAESFEEILELGPNLKTGEIKISNGNFSYESITAYNYFKDSPFLPSDLFDNNKKIPQTLYDIDMHIKPGELIAIVGKTGSGKSSFLNCIINELYKISGEVEVKGSVSYMAQDVFLMNNTVRNNILFGREYDEKSYNEVLELCQLREDLKI